MINFEWVFIISLLFINFIIIIIINSNYFINLTYFQILTWKVDMIKLFDLNYYFNFHYHHHDDYYCSCCFWFFNHYYLCFHLMK